MTGKFNPKKVENFTLIPVGCGPDICYAADFRVFTNQWNFYPDIRISIEGSEVINYGKVAVGLVGPFQSPALIDCRKIKEHAVWLIDFALQEYQQCLNMVTADPNGQRFVGCFLHRQDD
jgi:hypothetical protein